MSSRIFAGVAVLALLLQAACAPGASDCARPEVVCVGLVTSTAGLEDHGLNESAWQALQQAEKEGQIQRGDVIESVDSRDYGKNIAAFAADGYDVILTGGAGLRDETLLAARSYGDILFAGLNQEPAEEPLPNFTAVRFAEDQGGYLAGALAAEMTRTGVVGAVCETEDLGSMWRACEGFRAGAVSVNPDIAVLVEYHQTEFREDLFLDEDWGRAAAENLIRQGADVILGAGGRLGEAALQTAAGKGIWGVGWEEDAFLQAPGAGAFVLTSVMPDAGRAMDGLLSSLAGDAEVAPVIVGPMGLAPYHEAGRFIPASVQDMLANLAEGLRSGSVVTNVAPERPGEQ